MTIKGAFTDEEWTRIMRAPMVAGWRSRWPILARDRGAPASPERASHGRLGAICHLREEAP